MGVERPGKGPDGAETAGKDGVAQAGDQQSTEVRGEVLGEVCVGPLG